MSASVMFPPRRCDVDGVCSFSMSRGRGVAGSSGSSYSPDFFGGSMGPTSYKNMKSLMAMSSSSPPIGDGLMSQSYASSSGSRSFSVLPEILGSLAEPTMIINADTLVITACNVRCARLFEMEPEDIAGKELTEVVMLVNPGIEVGETNECFFINGKGQCMNLLMGVTAHPFIEDLLVCTVVQDDTRDQNPEIDIGKNSFSGENDEGIATEYFDDETGHPFKVDVTKFLGAGGSGSVCEGTWDSERVAAKFIACNNNDVLLSHYQEVKTLQDLQHYNIIRYKGSTVLYEETTIVVVMEFAEHGSLQSLVESPRAVSPDTLTDYIIDTLHALGFVHASGIVHRDVKPSNLLLCNGSGRVICKLTDFGSAIRKDLLKSQNPFLGTPVFMAPEQFEGQVGYYSDVWAVGLSSLFCVLRHAPYPAELVCNPLRLMFAIVDGLRPSIPLEGPEELLSLARWTLIDSPIERPSIAEVLQRLTGEVVPGESSEPITSPLTRDVLVERLTSINPETWHTHRRPRSSPSSPKQPDSGPRPNPKAEKAAEKSRCLVA
eukprot:EG_transcript_6743